MLKPGTFLVRDIESLDIQVDNTLVKSDIEHRGLVHEEAFADATLDHQWIHVDTERARTESPYKSTIAHGYLNLSVLPYLWGQILEVNNVKMLVNYGIEKLRFNRPVLAGDAVRLRASLVSLANLRGIAKAEIKVSLEIKDSPKTALDATVVFLYHFQ